MPWRSITDFLKHRDWPLKIADRLGRGRGRVRLADWLEHVPPAPAKAVELPAAAAKPFDAAAVTASVGGVDVAIIDSLDKIHPVTGELIPAHPADYLRANHIWSSAG